MTDLHVSDMGDSEKQFFLEKKVCLSVNDLSPKQIGIYSLNQTKIRQKKTFEILIKKSPLIALNFLK